MHAVALINRTPGRAWHTFFQMGTVAFSSSMAQWQACMRTEVRESAAMALENCGGLKRSVVRQPLGSATAIEHSSAEAAARSVPAALVQEAHQHLPPVHPLGVQRSRR